MPLSQPAAMIGNPSQAEGTWSTRTLGDCIVVNEPTYSSKYDWRFINYLETGNITENRISSIKPLTVGQDKIPSRAKRIIIPGDIVYSTVRPVQRHYGIIHSPPPNFLASTGFAVIRGKPEIACTDFVYWYMVQDQIVEHLQSIAEQNTSAYPAINPSDIESLEIQLPPIPEQQAVADVLNAFDTKIELNRQMNQALAEIVATLFKSWFIDFYPIRAKIDGRWQRGQSLPSLPEEAYDVFPQEFVTTGRQRLPTGWRHRPLKESYDLTMGQSPPGSTYNSDGDGLPFFQGSTDFGQRYPTTRRYCTAPTRIAAQDDTLVSVRAPVGTINMAWERCCIGRGVAAVRHKSGSRSFTYHSLLALHDALQEFEQAGTVFGAINKTEFESLQVLSPPTAIIEYFESCVWHLDQGIRANNSNSAFLAQQRDALLPKLVSGELSLADAH